MFLITKLFCILIIIIKIVNCDDNLKPYELNDILNGTFVNKIWNATWISDDSLLYTLDTDKSVYILNVKTNKERLLFDSHIMEKYRGATFTLSNDESYVLIRYNVQTIFRHSTTAQYAIYSIADEIYKDVQNSKPIQLAIWSPNGCGLIYVHENNIYYLNDPNVASNPKQLTIDGVPGIVYNGVPDWVYEEEVLGTGSALWFSPDGSRVAFAQFNDTLVKQYSYTLYGNPGNIQDQYPRTVSVRYPKVGTMNPIVQLKVYDLINDERSTTIYELDSDSILYDVKWTNNDYFVSVLMNRIQNKGMLYKCDMRKMCTFENYDLASENGWLINPTPIYNREGDKYVLIVSQPEDDDFFKHLILIDGINNKTQRLTYGKRVVIKCLGWNRLDNDVYYVSTIENEPSQEQVYVVNVDTLSDKCVTCDFQTPEGFCKYSSASFSKDYTYHVKICNGPGPNYITIDETTTSSTTTTYDASVKDGIVGTIWENNSLLREQMSNLLQPVIKDVVVNVGDGFTANVRLLLPPNMDESKKYPMVVEVYAGPDSNQISDQFTLGFRNYITTNRNYIYALIDGRGSGRRGDNILYQVYRRLGTVEIEDQISVTKYLQDNYNFIDRERTGVWGWSYGGFSTAWILVKDTENIFKFGLSVAPVTDFIYYDSIYTERYMGLPTSDDNEYGYNNTDITRNAESFKNKLFLLIHGNADDNVHYQQSMLLAKALENADVMFQQISYPDENHSLSHVYPHLYHSIDRFWARSFGLPDP